MDARHRRAAVLEHGDAVPALCRDGAVHGGLRAVVACDGGGARPGGGARGPARPLSPRARAGRAGRGSVRGRRGGVLRAGVLRRRVVREPCARGRRGALRLRRPGVRGHRPGLGPRVQGALHPPGPHLRRRGRPHGRRPRRGLRAAAGRRVRRALLRRGARRRDAPRGRGHAGCRQRGGAHGRRPARTTPGGASERVCRRGCARADGPARVCVRHGHHAGAHRGVLRHPPGSSCCLRVHPGRHCAGEPPGRVGARRAERAHPRARRAPACRLQRGAARPRTW